jgi:anti-sigma B factor antagonist
MIDTGVRDIVIDLAECSYIDSSGLGSLIYCQSSMRKAGGTLKLARVHGQVLTVMTLTKLADYFTLVDTAPLPEGALDIDIDGE